MSKNAMLALEDGTTFAGRSFGARGEVCGEAVFNTSMLGYQEIVTDPSYAGQLVTMAAPQIGNVGVNPHDEESARPQAAALLVRELRAPSNWRATASLHEYLAAAGVVGLEGFDTRRLVRHLRTHGAQRAALSTEARSEAALIALARATPSTEGLDLATPCSTKAPYQWETGSPRLFGEPRPARGEPLHVVACDYGLKRSMLALLVDAGCRVTVVPAWYSADAILALAPDGVFLTNGPGDPAAVPGAAATVAALLGRVPLFGICLGHQILALALGGRTFKMKFGHRGANQPVQDLETGRVEITSQNHGFAVDEESLRGKARVTHRNLNDGTVEGLSVPDAGAFSVQHHPEASPGPQESRHLFTRFVAMMRAR